MVFSVSLIHSTQFYVYIRSIGETQSFLRVVLLLAHHTRYLILNFGNITNLDLTMW